MGKGNNFRERDNRGGGRRDFDDYVAPAQPSYGGHKPSSLRPSSRPSQPAPSGPPVDATVKWFNGEKGFGFVELDGGGGDAFLHASSLNQAGHDTVAPGARLQVMVSLGQKGKQVAQILSVDESSAAPQPSRPAFARPSAPHGGGRPSREPEETVTGTVKWFDNARGFGFITDDQGGKDIFVHLRAVRDSGLDGVTEGQRVLVGVVQAQKGREAVTVASA